MYLNLNLHSIVINQFHTDKTVQSLSCAATIAEKCTTISKRVQLQTSASVIKPQKINVMIEITWTSKWLDTLSGYGWMSVWLELELSGLIWGEQNPRKGIGAQNEMLLTSVTLRTHMVLTQVHIDFHLHYIPKSLRFPSSVAVTCLPLQLHWTQHMCVCVWEREHGLAKFIYLKIQSPPWLQKLSHKCCINLQPAHQWTRNTECVCCSMQKYLWTHQKVAVEN